MAADQDPAVSSRDYIGINADLLRSQLQNISAAFWKPAAQKSSPNWTRDVPNEGRSD
ncbi:hypothetical protein [Microvirga sp. G4-2]|uniref:hypothetical protein n=1 Tax=Microvirga sp. G4-2 TaxID=3434467 RepID=UPI004044536D